MQSLKKHFFYHYMQDETLLNSCSEYENGLVQKNSSCFLTFRYSMLLFRVKLYLCCGCILVDSKIWLGKISKYQCETLKFEYFYCSNRIYGGSLSWWKKSVASFFCFGADKPILSTGNLFYKFIRPNLVSTFLITWGL